MFSGDLKTKVKNKANATNTPYRVANPLREASLALESLRCAPRLLLLSSVRQNKSTNRVMRLLHEASLALESLRATPSQAFGLQERGKCANAHSLAARFCGGTSSPHAPHVRDNALSFLKTPSHIRKT